MGETVLTVPPLTDWRDGKDVTVSRFENGSAYENRFSSYEIIIQYFRAKIKAFLKKSAEQGKFFDKISPISVGADSMSARNKRFPSSVTLVQTVRPGRRGRRPLQGLCEQTKPSPLGEGGPQSGG
ncbi:MAG: hypothetical protein IJ386_02420 [Clostridia bacterium]|nr:hypothetical protein [Clostridia bacterium]